MTFCTGFFFSECTKFIKSFEAKLYMTVSNCCVKTVFLIKGIQIINLSKNFVLRSNQMAQCVWVGVFVASAML